MKISPEHSGQSTESSESFKSWYKHKKVVFKHGLWAIIAISILTVSAGLLTSQSAWMYSQPALHFVPVDSVFARKTAENAPFDEVFKKAELVLLGEAQHGDGATFERKLEWIRLLHEHYGFDVLLFESSLWSGIDLNAYLKSGGFEQDSINRHTWRFWSSGKETAPLWKYLSDSKMETGGFDLQFNGPVPAILARLKGIVARLGAEEQTWVETRNWLEGLYVFSINGYFKPPPPEIAVKIKLEMDSLTAKSERAGAELDKLLLQNVVWSLRHRTLHSALTNPFRDSIMAKNILTLKEKIYPGKKIIIWAANAHILHRVGQTEILPFKTMGDYLHDTLDEGCVAVLFSSFKGVTRNVYSGSEVNIYEAGKNSLEYRLCEKFGREGLVDLQKMPDSTVFKLRVLGHGNRSARWARTAELLHFIPEMTPYHPL